MAHILIVDDEYGIRSGFRVFLEQQGHDVSDAPDGRKALAILASSSVDLLVTDILMPDVDGFELIQTVHREYPNVAVIAITGGGTHLPSRLLLDSARTFGATRTLHKPISLTTLLETVQTVLAAS